MYSPQPYYTTTPRPSPEPRYTHVSNQPESITNIVVKVQNYLNRTLDQLVHDDYRQYFSSSQPQMNNTDVVFKRLENDLLTNISNLIDFEIWKNYGAQVQKDGYMYSIGPHGEVSQNYNYAVEDLEGLKSFVKNVLSQKLYFNFEAYKTR